ncbi:hypothetical protein CR165_15220 [Pseudoroseomonas aestuarii]|uniref:AAA+ ATPase domain-containing protein n=2 Tax=Roseomonadaceae TaxID=3385906 RepID=A0A2U1V235_9PROT|nr:hypothetical protein CR165_15220 [Pseudoroseomonas aestuarii]
MSTMDQNEIDRLVRLSGRFRELYLPTDKSDEIQRDIRRLHHRDHGSSGEAGILLLVGGSGSGKSKLVLDYTSQFPDQPRAIAGPDGAFADRKDVLYFKAPNGSEKDVAEVWFAALTGQSIDHVVGRGRKRLVIQEDIVAVGREVGNRLVVADEFSQCLEGKDTAAIKRIASLCRYIVNAKGGPSLIIAGTASVLLLREADAEFRRRASIRHELLPLDWDIAESREFLQDVLMEWDEFLRDNVFGVLSGLAGAKMAYPLCRAASGYLGDMATLIETAAAEAVYDVAAGKADRLTYAHLVKAYGKSAVWTAERPAFPEAVGPTIDTGPEKTRLRGRTRRSDRHHNFRP